MTGALAKLVCPSPSNGDALAALRRQITDLGELVRTYPYTNHENKRKRLRTMHERMRELVEALEHTPQSGTPES